MHFKIGSDICSVTRVEETLAKFGERFLDRVLTENEKAYVLSVAIKDRASKVAARFAAKEATAKTLQTGFKGLSFKEIEVVRNSAGAPSLKLNGRASALAAKLNLSSFELTISHEREYAIAFVLGYGETQNSSR